MLTETIERKTVSDYEELPEGAPYQLINGELVMNPAPHFFHQRIIARLTTHLNLFVEKHNLGDVAVSPDVYLSETDIFQPDIVFVSNERLNLIVEGRVKGAPDLAIEVLSPSTGYYDLSHKKNLYESSGVKEYWIVYPQEETIEVFENVAGEFHQIARVKRQGNVASKLLQGFSVKLADIF
ncbi:MAG: Uma2 family endonuclease [Bacteroidota bacterium]